MPFTYSRLIKVIHHLATYFDDAHTWIATTTHLNESTFGSYCFSHIWKGIRPQTTDVALQRCKGFSERERERE